MAEFVLSLFWVVVAVFIVFVGILLICGGVVLIKITKDFWKDGQGGDVNA